jgi:hypothetical protein
MMKLKIEIEAPSKDDLVDALADILLKVEKREQWDGEMRWALFMPSEPSKRAIEMFLPTNQGLGSQRSK